MRKLAYMLAAFVAAAIGYWQFDAHTIGHLIGNGHNGLSTAPQPLMSTHEGGHSGHGPLGEEDIRKYFKNYVAQPVAYPTSVNPWPLSTLGDGSTAYGGTAPAMDDMPDFKSNFNLSQWQSSVSSSYQPIDGLEAKFRTHCEFSHVAYEDPLLYPGKKNISHLHTFFGNTLMGANSTYETLRKTGGSTCGGGPINRSGYWFPSVMKDNALGDGRTMVNKPLFATVYYNVGKSFADTNRFSAYPRGLGYVFGFNMADPNNTARAAEITAANVGASGAFYSENSGTGWTGWKCETSNGSNANSPVPGSTYQPYLRNADGTATLTCPTNEMISANLNGPTCWDGVNLLSPNGRGHVRHSIKNNARGSAPYCPNGWYMISQFELIIYFKHNGPDDYKEWYLSSDRMTDAQYIHADQPCHASNITNGISGSFCNGQTMHSDWFGAWDYDVMKAWMRECTGTTVDGVAGTSRSCIDTTYGNFMKGLTSGAAPDRSRVPQLSLSSATYDLTTRWTDIPRGGPEDGSP